MASPTSYPYRPLFRKSKPVGGRPSTPTPQSVESARTAYLPSLTPSLDVEEVENNDASSSISSAPRALRAPLYGDTEAINLSLLADVCAGFEKLPVDDPAAGASLAIDSVAGSFALRAHSVGTRSRKRVNSCVEEERRQNKTTGGSEEGTDLDRGMAAFAIPFPDPPPAADQGSGTISGVPSGWSTPRALSTNEERGPIVVEVAPGIYIHRHAWQPEVSVSTRAFKTAIGAAEMKSN